MHENIHYNKNKVIKIMRIVQNEKCLFITLNEK